MTDRTTLSVCVALLLALAGCDSGETARQGFTACGDFPSGPVECQPGQYCADATFSECLPGCTSNVNCADGQTCAQGAGEAVGVCQNTAPTPPMGTDAGPPAPPAGNVALCQDACQAASFNCEDSSITASEVSACDAWCRDGATTDSERDTFMACVEAAFFTEPICDEAGCLP